MTATKRKPKPITANPMFPFVTALWFATFLGLGSFAVAPALLEGPVVALGIPAIIPAAAPPLGFTARVALALLMMGGGAIAGFLVGRWLGREKVAAPLRTRAFGKASHDAAFVVPRPINPAEDLGEPLDSPIVEDMPLRRRALSLTEEPQLAMPTESAPLPGGLPWEQYSPVAVAPSTPEGSRHLSQAVDPLGLETFLEEAHGSTLQDDAIAADLPPSQPEATAVPETVEIDEIAVEPAGQTAEPVAHQPDPIRSSPSLLQAHAAAATPLEAAPLDNLGLVQLIERLALAISRRANGANAQSGHGAVSASPVAQVAPAAQPEFVVATPAPQPVIARFEAAPAAPVAASPLSIKPERFADPERVVQLRPTAMQPVSLAADEGDDDTEDAGEELGLGRFLRLSSEAPTAEPEQSAAVASAEPAPEPEVAEERYPSLLDMGPVAARREPLRIDDGLTVDSEDDAEIEPVVVFPGQQTPINSPTARPFEKPSITPLAGSPLAAPGRAAPSATVPDAEAIDPALPIGPTPDAEEADRALRAALATLQRMTAQG